MGEHEAQRPDDVRRRAQQHLALGQRLTHQRKRVKLEVAQAAVDQLGGGGGRGAAEIAHLGQEHAQPAALRVTGDATTVDSATDDGEVMDRTLHGFPMRQAAFAVNSPVRIAAVQRNVLPRKRGRPYTRPGRKDRDAPCVRAVERSWAFQADLGALVEHRGEVTQPS
jgi:hypothetical protein